MGTAPSDRLTANSERILGTWVQRLKAEVPAAAGEASPILVNTLPAVLRQLAEALSPQHPRRTATEGSTVAEEHGGERLRMTHFKLEDLISEYRLLRQVIFEVLEEREPLTREERNILNASLDQFLMKACTGYTLMEAGVREQFFATLAHDLRTPLSAAKATAGLLMRKPGSEQTPRWAARVVENIDRVDRMLQDLLDAMRVQSDAKLPLQLQEQDLVEVVRQSIENLQVEHGGRFILAASEPVIGWFGADVLQRAVENLANNAVKYGAPDQPVTLRIRTTQGRTLIQVHNHGSHIPPEQQETLFRAFRRLVGAETSGKRGWGLGLAQARAAAQAHGGSIGVDSLPELGTTFTLDIPVDARPFQKRIQG